MKHRVLVACEYSARVRDAFRAKGCDAWSCDLEPCEGDSTWHLKKDVLSVLDDGWDLMISHPPCTHLAVSGARHFAKKIADGRQQQALEFVQKLLNASIPRIALENPISIISSRIRKPDQIVQPWMFGHSETKATCFWLKNLPPLMPTHCDGDLFCQPEPAEKLPKVWLMPPSETRWKDRSRTYKGIAQAMADQWAPLLYA